MDHDRMKLAFKLGIIDNVFRALGKLHISLY